MEEKLKQKTVPVNYILIGNSDFHRFCSEAIIRDAKSNYPELFEGQKDYFYFELRYTAPFEKNFIELKRLQGTAAEAAGRRAAFKGYVVIDLSDYISHSSERYLDISLRFLIDMSGYWKYIFLINGTDSKAVSELIRKVLITMSRDLYIEVKENDRNSYFRRRLEDICEKNHSVCTFSVKKLLMELVEQEGFDEDTVLILLEDVSRHYKGTISMNIFVNYFANGISLVKYMLTAKEYNRLNMILVQRKANLVGEKDEI